jgi:AraC-like DNA-binding protein
VESYETVFPYSRFTLGFHLDSPYLIKSPHSLQEQLISSAFSPIGEKVTLVKPVEKHTLTVGAHLFAYSLPMFTRIPAKEIVPGMALEAIFGKDIPTIHHKLYEAKPNLEKINLLEAYLLSKLIHPANAILEYVVKQILSTSGSISIASLAQETGLSDRMLRIYFERNVGCSIKTLAKIVRFEHSFQSKLIVQANLTDRALVSGYYDQSHYIRDFKQLTGLNPKEFFKNRQDFRFVQF